MESKNKSHLTIFLKYDRSKRRWCDMDSETESESEEEDHVIVNTSSTYIDPTLYFDIETDLVVNYLDDIDEFNKWSEKFIPRVEINYLDEIDEFNKWVENYF